MSGKIAPSFIATIAVVILLIVGYLAWDVYLPGPVGRSDQIVRELAAAAAAEIGSLRKALREQTQRYKADPDSLAQVRRAIDDLAADAQANLAELASAASEEIESMSGIGLRTQENRLGRLRQRQTEAEMKVNVLADEARLKLPKEGP